MTNILVTGIGGTRSIAVMNALRSSDLDVRIIGTDANYFNAGSYQCDAAYNVPLASEPGYIDRLSQIIRDEDIKIVFATVEKEVLFLSKHKSQLESELGVAIVVPDTAILDVCFDKFKTQDFLQSHGFIHIPTIYDDEQKVSGFVSEYDLPIIRKPVFGYGSRGLSILRTQDDVEQHQFDTDYVLQQFIENQDTETFYNTVLNEYTAEVFMNKDGSAAGGIIIKRALHAGETVAGYRVDDDETLAYLTGIARELGIAGPCNFQYRKSRDQVYIFEINPLFSGTTSIRASYGFNGVALAVRSFVYGDHGTIGTDQLTSDYFIRYLKETFVSPEDITTLKETGSFSRGD